MCDRNDSLESTCPSKSSWSPVNRRQPAFDNGYLSEVITASHLNRYAEHVSSRRRLRLKATKRMGAHPVIQPDPRHVPGFIRVPGMTHRLPFQGIWDIMVRRYRTEGRRRQGKGITRDGVSEGSMRQNPCTQRTANRLYGVSEEVMQT
jgi:hypothetical protein